MMREVHIPNRSIYLSSSTTVQWLIAPNRRPFLGVTYGLRAGFILRPRAGLAGRAPNVRRVVYARRYSQVGRWVVWVNCQASKAVTTNAGRPGVN